VVSTVQEEDAFAAHIRGPTLYKLRGPIFYMEGVCTREKKGRLEAWRVPNIENLLDAVNRVHYIVILLLHIWSTPHITAGQV
jgi:hypothetical protein